MKNFRERLDFAFKQRGINQAEFARLMNTEPQNVNLWKVRGGIPRAHFIKACDKLHVNPSWLSDGIGEWDKITGTTSLNIRHVANESPASVHEASLHGYMDMPTRQVPLISSVTAGQWGEPDDEFDLSSAEAWVTVDGKVSRKTFALKIQGDSMEPVINDGDIIIVDPERQANHKSIIVVRQNNNTEATCKQLIIESGNRYLQPINPRYPVMEMHKDAIICGVVINLRRNLT